MAFNFIAILSLMTAHFPERSKLARCDEISSFQQISSRNKIDRPEGRSGSEIQKPQLAHPLPRKP
jgi:hypothetical protein